MSLEEPYSWYGSPLHCAIHNGYPKLVKMLLNAGCNKESLDIMGRNPLLHAISKVVDQDKMKEDLFGNSNMIIIKSRKHYYSHVHKQIALDLIDAGADINNQRIQKEICQKRDYGLMVKVLKMKPNNLHPDIVINIWSGEISDPIATDFLMLYFFNYALEKEDCRSFIIDKLSQVLHCAGNINRLNNKIGRVIKRCDQKFYSWYKHDYYQKMRERSINCVKDNIYPLKFREYLLKDR